MKSSHFVKKLHCMVGVTQSSHERAAPMLDGGNKSRSRQQNTRPPGIFRPDRTITPPLVPFVRSTSSADKPAPRKSLRAPPSRSPDQGGNKSRSRQQNTRPPGIFRLDRTITPPLVPFVRSTSSADKPAPRKSLRAPPSRSPDPSPVREGRIHSWPSIPEDARRRAALNSGNRLDVQRNRFSWQPSKPVSLPPVKSIQTGAKTSALTPSLSMTRSFQKPPQRTSATFAFRLVRAGECLAHPCGPCNCEDVQTPLLSQSGAWTELAKRFKQARPPSTTCHQSRLRPCAVSLTVAPAGEQAAEASEDLLEQHAAALLASFEESSCFDLEPFSRARSDPAPAQYRRRRSRILMRRAVL